MDSQQRLTNKTIVILGGTVGVARALINVCLENGANIVFGDNNLNLGLSIEKDLLRIYPSRIVFKHTDVLNITDCQQLFDVAINEFHKIDGFVNYAGVTPKSGLTDCDELTYDRIFDINLKAAFFCTQFAINSMLKNNGGAIILFGSSHAWVGQKDRAAYAISKGALFTLCEHISHNYAQNKIRCNYLTMGWTPTEGELSLRSEQGMNKEQLMDFASSILPMGRMLKYEDYVPALLYLLSDDSSMVTGSNFRITGGEYI